MVVFRHYHLEMPVLRHMAVIRLVIDLKLIITRLCSEEIEWTQLRCFNLFSEVNVVSFSADKSGITAAFGNEHRLLIIG